MINLFSVSFILILYIMVLTLLGFKKIRNRNYISFNAYCRFVLKFELIKILFYKKKMSSSGIIWVF